MKTIQKIGLTLAAVLAFGAFVFGVNLLFSSFSAQRKENNGNVAAVAKKTPTANVSPRATRTRRTRTPAPQKTNPPPSATPAGNVATLHVIGERRVDDILQCNQGVMISPDRKQFICSNVQGGRGVWLGTFEKGLTKQLATKGGYVEWSPDGKKIAYTIGVPFGRATTLYEIEIETGKQIEVGQTRDARNFRVDKQGRIFFVGPQGLTAWSSRSGAENSITDVNARLAGMDQSGFSGDPLAFDSAFFVSPDGQQIVFQNVYDDKGTLTLTDLNSGTVTILTDQVGNATLPLAWSPDGTQLAYSTRTEHGLTPLEFNGSMLQLADANGANPKEIFRTDRCVDLRYVTWLPDGQTLLFVCTEGGNSFEVYWHYMALDPKTGAVKELFSNGEGLDLVNDGFDILILRSVENTGDWIIELSQ